MHSLYMYNVLYYTIHQTSSKLPANVFKIHVNCWTFAAICHNGAGRLLDRVNTPFTKCGSNRLVTTQSYYAAVRIGTITGLARLSVRPVGD